MTTLENVQGDIIQKTTNRSQIFSSQNIYNIKATKIFGNFKWFL